MSARHCVFRMLLRPVGLTGGIDQADVLRGGTFARGEVGDSVTPIGPRAGRVIGVNDGAMVLIDHQSEAPVLGFARKFERQAGAAVLPTSVQWEFARVPDQRTPGYDCDSHKGNTATPQRFTCVIPTIDHAPSPRRPPARKTIRSRSRRRAASRQPRRRPIRAQGFPNQGRYLPAGWPKGPQLADVRGKHGTATRTAAGGLRCTLRSKFVDPSRG